MEYKKQLLKGKVWVVSGKVCVKDDAGVVPTIQIDDACNGKIAIRKNGQVVSEAVVSVTEKDTISVEIVNEIIPPVCRVKTDKEQLKAFIEVEPGYEITRKLKNTFPSRTGILTLEEQKTMTEKVSIDDIKEALKSAGIFYGVKEEVIIIASQTEQLNSYEVAVAIPPQEGRNGYVEMKVDSKIKRRLKKDEKGTIDFRESQVIPAVEAGDLLGVIHPPLPGNAGHSVTNQLIPPALVTPVTVYPGKGTTLEKNQIIATRSGRPHIYQKKHIVKVAIIPQLIQESNVGLASGNIRFFGDVEVHGEVEENMRVAARNNILIDSSINRSTITAGNAIVCGGNVANALLSVGEKNGIIRQLNQHLGTLAAQLKELYELLTQVIHSAAYKTNEPHQKLGAVFKFLLNRRFNTLTDTAKEYIHLVRQEKDFLSVEWEESAECLNQLLFTERQTDLTLAEMKTLLKMMQEIQEMSLFDSEENRGITVASSTNSTLICNGNIHITGEGCLNSNLKAQGKVTIIGYFRGGSITTRGDIEANVVGTSAGIKTTLSVSSGNRIHIEKACEGTELHIGRYKVTLTGEQTKISAHLNAEGILVLR